MLTLKHYKCYCLDVRNIYSPVAQSVEQVAVNHPVGGSNPSGGVRTNLYFGRGFFITRTTEILDYSGSDMEECLSILLPWLPDSTEERS